MTTPQHLRVFLASPGDVADERALVRHLLKDELPYDVFLRGRVTFDIVSWDDPAAPTPMPARLSPQEAVIQSEGEPSTCDIVVVVLWSRLGTHLDLTKFKKGNGEIYLSGTEWEFENACKAQPQPDIFVYRRTEKPKVELGDPTLSEKLRQFELVNQFFERFMNPDGSFRGSVTPYDTPTAFKERLATDLKRILHKRLDQGDTGPTTPVEPAWTRPPYPGLRAFTPDEGPIFFGRGREVDALIARLRDPAQRFLAVVGASGTGKSSIVRAGLIPRLHDDAIEGSQGWRVVIFKPGALGDNPFLALVLALAAELARVLPTLAHKPPIEIAMELAKAPQRISEYVISPTGGAVLLFMDQLEELFTHAAVPYREPFGALLAHAVTQSHMRVVATLRADFLPQGVALPDLAQLIQAPAAIFPLAPPGPAALADMIRRPAERAGLVLEDGLADEILKDAGTDPGALPLMAFCLEELYRQTAPDHRLTVNAYEALGRLRGAISRRADALLKELRKIEDVDLDAALPRVFQALVHVDAAGTATRRRAFQDELGTTVQIRLIIDNLAKGRLLAAEDVGVTLAHEALISEWPALREWLDCNRAQMQRVQMLIAALSDANKDVRRSAAETLGQIGLVTAEVVPALITALGDADKGVRWSAAGALGQIGPTAVPALITALDDADKDVRWSATYALGQIGPAAAAAVPTLITALGDAEKNVRGSAAWALGQIGPATAEVVPTLITALSDAEKNVRGSAAWALGQIGPPAAVPALITALGDAGTEVRRAAVQALGRIGPPAAAAVPVLISALGDADADARGNATRALGQIGPAAVPALITALGDADKNVRRSAAYALGQIGPAAVPVLISALGDADKNVRGSAAYALGQIGPAVVPALITALGDADKNVRRSAAEALGKIRPATAEAVPALITALGDADKGVRWSAAGALKWIRSASPVANST